MLCLNGTIINFIKQFAEIHGRPGVEIGFADISDIDNRSDEEQQFDKAIVFAFPYSRESLAGVINGPTKEFQDEKVSINGMIENLTEVLVGFIHAHGFVAAPLNVKSEKQAVGNSVDEFSSADDDKSNLSLCLLSASADVGWVGKNGLVVTKKYGSAVRIGVVLTDVPLECCEQTLLSRCSRCIRCVEQCPADAITGLDWRPDINHTLVDMNKCHAECKRLSTERFGHSENLCGICTVACPYTASYLNRTED